MEFHKSFKVEVQHYDVVDGPVMETSPNRRVQGKFIVEEISVTKLDDTVTEVHLSGTRLKADGTPGNSNDVRTLKRGGFPEWLNEILDISM